ncbi:hypothetical protein C0Q70_15043 [Pomacea canaliculata]|uniref:Uncharacterized protein n=1 Tax=Pomacea canaliculata TaxID=400727 RepID=A0A2T7NTQ0_POMCA|nr:hypothetical protein C0Q70_15043 [Pomacea canaliculata]
MERRYGDRSVELNHESDLVYKKQNCFPHSEDPPKVKGRLPEPGFDQKFPVHLSSDLSVCPFHSGSFTLPMTET